MSFDKMINFLPYIRNNHLVENIFGTNIDQQFGDNNQNVFMNNENI